MNNGVFNYKEAIERVGDEELLDELLDDFLEFADDVVHDLKKAIAEGNSVMVRNTGHTMKGTAANLSLPNLSAIGAELEYAGTKGLTDSYSELYEKLLAVVAEFKQFMADKQKKKKNIDLIHYFNI